jgi:hypothetical protein
VALLSAPVAFFRAVRVSHELARAERALTTVTPSTMTW